jgi:hypothetical protein
MPRTSAPLSPVILVLLAACSVVQPGTDAFDSGTNTATVGNSGGTDATSETSTGAGSVDTTGAASSSTGDAESETGSEPESATSTTTQGAGITTDDSTSTDGGIEPASPCCGPLAGGCDDAAIEACVCAEDAYCCDAWDIACAIEVEDFGCAECQQDDEVASCTALCTVFVECAPQLGFDTVQACLDGECLGLLDQGTDDGEACLEAMTRYNACIGVLDCTAFDQYLDQQPPGAFPCAGFQADMFDACPFIGA